MPNIRGLTGWLQQKKVLREISIEELRGATIGVDAWKYFSSYLPTDAYSEVVGQIPFERIYDVIKAHLRLFAKYNITPVFVLSGVPSTDRIHELAHPTVAISEGARGHNNKNKKKKPTTQKGLPVTADDMSALFEDKGAAVRDWGWDKMQQGATEAAAEVFSGVEGSLTSQHRKVLADILQELGVAVMIAPYQVAPQLAWLDKAEHKMTHASFGNNDLLLYGTSTVLTLFNLISGTAQLVSYKDVLQTIGINHRQLVHASVLAGYLCCPTFPAVSSLQFSFANILALVVKYKSLQDVIDSYAFKQVHEKISYAKSLNKALNEVEGALCLGYSGEVVCVRSHSQNAERVCTEKNKIEFVPSMMPQIPLPPAVASLVSSNAVATSTVAALIGGKVIDLPVHVPSHEVHVLLDWANTHIRGPALRLAVAALSATEPIYEKALQVRDGAMAETTDANWDNCSPSVISNVRWSDQCNGVWPRDLTPKTDVRIGQLLSKDTSEKVTRSIVISCMSLARTIVDRSDFTITLPNVLMAAVTANPTRHDSNDSILSNTRVLVITSVLLVLFSLGFVDECAHVTNIGSAIASALATIPVDAPAFLHDNVFLALLLAHSRVIDSRILTLTACRPHMEQTVVVGKGLNDLQHQRVRLLTRLCAVQQVDVGSCRVELSQLKQELCGISNIANALLTSLRFALDCSVITTTIMGGFVGAAGIHAIDSLKNLACDFTQITSIMPYSMRFTSDPTKAISLWHALTDATGFVPVEEPAVAKSDAKVYFDHVVAIVKAAEAAGLDLSFSAAQLEDAMTIL